MNREEMLEAAHFLFPPALAGTACRPLSATNYALLRKHLDDSGAVQTIIAAFILAGPREQVFRLSRDADAFAIAALEFGDRVTVQELDEFSGWLSNQIAAVNAAQTEDASPGKPDAGAETHQHGLQPTESPSPNPPE